MKLPALIGLIAIATFATPCDATDLSAAPSGGAHITSKSPSGVTGPVFAIGLVSRLTTFEGPPPRSLWLAGSAFRNEPTKGIEQ